MFTSKKLTALTAVISSVLLTATVVQASDVLFAFEANSAQSPAGKQIFEFDDGALTLSAVSDATVRLTVNSDLFSDAAFEFNATQVGSTELLTIAGRSYSATAFDGSFRFLQQMSGFVILSATFQEAVLFARTGANNAGFFQSDGGADLVQFVYGPALGALAGQEAPPEGFSFALGDVSPAFSTSVAGQLESFTAAASFVGQSAVIPEPSTFVLTFGSILGSMLLWRRRS